MNKKIFIFILSLLILFPICSALTIGISPATIKLSETQNEITCENFTIFSESGFLFSGEIKWSKENSRDINQYTSSSKDLKINASFPNWINAGQHQICISAENKGNYFGALTYKMSDSSYAIGTWIELNVTKDNSELSPITGNVIKEINYKKIFLFSPILFLIILIFLLSRLKKNKTEFSKNI
jgi:hypothetical protein